MKVLHLTKLILFLSAVLVHITIAKENQQQNQQQTQLQTPSHNNDDTSLFRDVENAIDDDSEQDDAYRILKSLQDVTQEDEDDDDQDTVEENDDEETTEDDDQEEDDDHTNIEQDDDEDVDEEDEDEDEEDFTPEFPEFQNEETTDFFEHLPQQPMDHAIDNQLKDDIIDDVDEDTDELTQPVAEEEDDDEQEVTKETVNEPAVPSFPTDNSNIPWQRPDLVQTDENSNFYQDIYFKDTEKTKLQSQQGFKIWYIASIFFVLLIVYRSSFKRRVSLVTKTRCYGR